MAFAWDNALLQARDHVARSARLIDRQEALIETLERLGSDTSVARALHYTMCRSLLLMNEYLAHLDPSRGRDLERPRSESLDDWVKLLTLAMDSAGATKH